MSLPLKFFCFLMVFGFAGLFVLKKPDGTPWLSLGDFVPDMQSVTDSIGNTVPDSLTGADDVAVYRWKDADGNWQYSDKSPSHITAEQKVINTHLNRDLAPEKIKTVASKPKGQGKALLIKDSSLSPTTLSPDKISKLVDDAQNIQNLVDDRKRLQDKALGLNQ